jgi:hypothetical protein
MTRFQHGFLPRKTTGNSKEIQTEQIAPERNQLQSMQQNSEKNRLDEKYSTEQYLKFSMTADFLANF